MAKNIFRKSNSNSCKKFCPVKTAVTGINSTETKTMLVTCRKIKVEGIVQGVGFRPFVYRMAIRHGIRGHVRNTGGRVEITAEGTERQIDSFLHDIEADKPSESHINSIEYTDVEIENCRDFSIVKSSNYSTPDSILAPDMGICRNCGSELFDPVNRRYGYPFISCTECGPRYTLTEALPYDRCNTSMSEFYPCRICDKEYSSYSDRRFHAQTVCCQDCGPELSFADSAGNILSRGSGAITECAQAIDDAKIVAVKGYGGFHLVCDAFQEKAVETLRSRLGRGQQPFAIMAKDIKTAKMLVHINDHEEKLLLGSKRPVVVLEKKEENCILQHIAPGLHNIGVMLPYSGIQQLLFHESSGPAYVMTSANMPGLPMITDNDVAIRDLAHVADNYLMHNLTIKNRIDDSVIRSFSDGFVFIRRSRGYVPQPVELPVELVPCAGVGAELNNTLLFASGNRAYISPHIGNTSHFETAAFHADVFRNFSKMTSIEPENWGCDLHPQFNTTRFALENGGNNVVAVQHHFAHVVSLMADAGLDRDSRIIGIALDGTGYGSDGTVWGGEILETGYDYHIRHAHLKTHAMPGGDLCSYYPERAVISMLKSRVGEDELMEIPFELKYGRMEARTVLEQLNRNINISMSSSSGRVLDAAAALLGICRYRSYQGEPAMKLESAARNGKNTSLELVPAFRKNVLDTGMLLYELYERRNDYPVPELAYAFEEAFAGGLAKLACKAAKRADIGIAGLTGGVACNEHITHTIRDVTEAYGLDFISHARIPCGDAGVSLGQAIVAGLKEKE